MKKKEFDKKFGRRIFLSFECSDAEKLFIDIWQCFEEYGEQARVDELKIAELEKRLDNREKRIGGLEEFNRKNLDRLTKARGFIDKPFKELI